MSKLSKPLLMYRGGQRLAALLAAFVLFISCDNIYENPVNQNTNPQTPKYVTVSGSITTRGALPSQLVRSLRPAETTRTAFATLPTLTSENYTIKAKNQATGSTEEYTATVAANCASYTVGIPDVAAGKSFKIFAEVSGTYGVFLTGETSTPFTLDADHPVNQEQDITLKASQSSGTGMMVLTVTVAADAGISSARVRYTTDQEHTKSATISSTSYTFSIGQVLGTEIAGGLSSGAYPMTFEFYSSTDCTGTPIYSFSEIINIFANMKTDTWVQNGAEPWFTTTAGTTTCQVTKALVEGYELTDIYVDADAGAANNSGTFLKPLNDLAASLAMPHNTNKDYTIHIKGTFTGHYTIETSTFKSLTLCGESGLDTNEQPVACIDGNQTIGSTLTINTTKSVTIKSLKITGGKATQGGGINLTSGTLTLAEDSLITGNRASTGGGVYVATGDDTTVLNVTSNATVFGNTNMADTPSPSNVHLRGDKKINVTGPLKKGSGASAKKAKIGVSTATVPSLTSTKIITNGYGYGTGGKNDSVGPWEYFCGDAFAIELDTSNEACLKASGGTLTIGSFAEDVSLSVDKTFISTTATSKKITVTAKVTKNGTTSTITAGSGTGKISYAFELRCNGEKVSNSSTYYSTGTNYLTYATGLPLGKYTIVVNGTYNGKTYSGEFAVPLIEAKELNTKPVVLLAGTDGSGGTSATYVEFGNWPQTLKEDNVTVDENITKATVTGGYTYYLGSDGYWYAKCTESKFGSYGTKYANGTTIGTGTKYFKVEPIKWRVLTKTYNHDRDWSTTQKWLLLSDKVLIGGVAFYDNNTATRTINGNTVYPNNYEHSKIRAYLNGISYNKNGTSNSDYLNKGFYQIAFDSNERSKVLETTLTHNLESTGDSSNPYATDVTTNDRVFLLSKKDCMTTSYGFTDSTSANELRALKLTDWTRANRGYFKDERNGFTYWGLRSPDSSTTEYKVYHVGDDGTLTWTTSVTAGTPDVPAICIDPYYGE